MFGFGGHSQCGGCWFNSGSDHLWAVLGLGKLLTPEAKQAPAINAGLEDWEGVCVWGGGALIAI